MRTMRILIAPDSFKGSLTSAEAALAMAHGVRSVMPDVEITTMPLADGGEGTADVLASFQALQTDCIDAVHDKHLLIESARLIGLNLSSMQGDVFECGSEVLGKAVLAALDAGQTDIRIALGGSATVDGGLGLLLALGCRVLGADGLPVSADLNGLMQVKVMDIQQLDQRLQHVHMTILSDVQNPLCGKDGAVRMYGAQKGIKVAQLHAVELAMQNWADLCETTFGMSVQTDMGTGAAGGLGFALRLLGGRVISGAEYVMQAMAFERVASSVDWVMTGEGLSDTQTLHGKLPFMVAQASKKAGVNVVLISGDVMNEAELLECFDAVVAARSEGVSLAEGMRQADRYLSEAAASWMRSVLDGNCTMLTR
ncbi:glycerate kinase [Mariprofundus ferrooxydans]|nr:glycerate kinase [Mariprofundus ferrooxydans]